MGQSFKGLWRNGVMTLASITVLISCLIVIGSFALLTLNINVNLKKIGLMNEIVVFVDESKTEEEVSAIGEQIRALDNVSEVKFISKDEALAEEKEKYSEYSALYELVDGDNPLRDSFVITYEDNSKASTTVYQVNHIDGIAKVNFRLDLVTTIEKIKSGISLVLIWFMAILFVVSIFVIINTIKLAVHSKTLRDHDHAVCRRDRMVRNTAVHIRGNHHRSHLERARVPCRNVHVRVRRLDDDRKLQVPDHHRLRRDKDAAAARVPRNRRRHRYYR